MVYNHYAYFAWQRQIPANMGKNDVKMIIKTGKSHLQCDCRFVA